jgi:hypothetical protein
LVIEEDRQMLVEIHISWTYKLNVDEIDVVQIMNHRITMKVPEVVKIGVVNEFFFVLEQSTMTKKKKKN